MPEPFFTIDSVRVPRFFYGTAWKEDATRPLVELALDAGFRGIDTANQRKHYHEAAVGEAVAAAQHANRIARDDLFLQTKFTFRRGQDQRLPYDPLAPIAIQVEQSFASSLQHLGVSVIDSYLLHGPSWGAGLTAHDWEAWRAMESLHDRGLVRFLGVSNFALDQLDALLQDARVRPRFVQNRCYASQGWDRHVRRFAAQNGMTYQGFSLLTANRQVSGIPAMMKIAARHGKTVNQVIFRFALDVGMIPLTGTCNRAHMREDLAVFDFRLDPQVIQTIESLLSQSDERFFLS